MDAAAIYKFLREFVSSAVEICQGITLLNATSRKKKFPKVGKLIKCQRRRRAWVRLGGLKKLIYL